MKALKSTAIDANISLPFALPKLEFLSLYRPIRFFNVSISCHAQSAYFALFFRLWLGRET